jgi:hypothetical protein
MFIISSPFPYHMFLITCLRREAQFFGRTLEHKLEKSRDFQTIDCILTGSGDHLVLKFPIGSGYSFMRVDDPDLVLGIEPDITRGVPVRAYIRDEGKIIYDYIPPDYSRKQPVSGMINPYPVLVRVEAL